MKCKIIFERDPKTLKITDKIKAVKADNGKRSKLFDDIRGVVVDDNESLNNYYKIYTDEFIDKFGNWKDGKDKSKLDENGEPLFELVKDIILPSEVKLASVGEDNVELINNLISLDFYEKWLDNADLNDETEYLAQQELNDRKSKIPDGTTIESVLSKYTDQSNINSILDLIKSNDPDNIELAKQIIKGIVDNPGMYSASNIKPGVDFVFEQNPELAKIGSKEEYSEYLDSNNKLYRSEHFGDNSNVPEWMSTQPEFQELQKATGRWFYKTLEDAVNHSKLFEDNGPVSYISIDNMEQFNARNNKFAGGFGKDGNEYFIDPTVILPEKIILGSTKDVAQFEHYLKTRKASPSGATQPLNIRSKYFSDNETQSHKSILRKIVDSGGGFNPLAEKLLTINSKDILITLKPVDSLYSFTDDNGNKQSSIGFYKNGRIEMAEFGNFKGGSYGFESNVIHEILHGFTWNELRINSKNTQELKAIYNEALKYKDSFSDQYSISNIDEFIVAIFTNANFIRDIQKIPSIYPEKHQSLWEDVLEFFKKWFKFNEKESTLLDDAFYVANKILIDYSNDPDSTKYKQQLEQERLESLNEEYVWTDDEGNLLANNEKSKITVSDDLIITTEISKEEYDSFKIDENYDAWDDYHYKDIGDVHLRKTKNDYIKYDLKLSNNVESIKFYSETIDSYKKDLLRYNKYINDAITLRDSGNLSNVEYESEVERIYNDINYADTIISNNESGIDEKINEIKSYLSQYTDSETIDNILQYLIHPNYEAQTKENIEIGKMLIKGIIENYDNSNNTILFNTSDPSDTQIEDQFKLRNEDGSRKRYTENKALELARKLNKENPNRPFKFTVIKIMGEKGDNRVYHAVKVVSKLNDSLFSLSSNYQGQPKSTQPDSIKLDLDAFKQQAGPNGYSDEQLALMAKYNDYTGILKPGKVPVKVSDLKSKKLRETYEKKGIEIVERYAADNEKGYMESRVSDRQDIIKVASQTAEKSKEQENNPKSILARKMGTKMHDLNQRILESIVQSNNPIYQLDVYRDTDFNLWFEKVKSEFEKTDEYKKLVKEALDIFENESGTKADGSTYQISVASNMVDKLVKSMFRLYHQGNMTQKEINIANKTNHKPIFLTETPIVDRENEEPGTMDIAVLFSDGTASIFDHKFTDLDAVRHDVDDTKAKKDWAEIKRIRRAQGLPVDDTYNKYQSWYYVLPAIVDLYKKEDSWNAQIGRYTEILTKLYGVKSIRQARILPVATTYTKVGKEKQYDPDKSKVAIILTGDNDYGISQIALEVEKTGDVNLDRFIQMLIANKHNLAKERLEKKAYDDPKYNERIKKLDDSIQALLQSRDVTKIADSIQALADQIKKDLDNQTLPITFTDIINHLNEIEMYDSFIRATAGELDKMEQTYSEQIKNNEENPYTTFKLRLGAAKVELDRSAESMHQKMTSMIYEENAKGNFMSESLFGSFERQQDMTELGKMFTHLREVNHPIISLFSQLLDKVNTNKVNKRRELETEINKHNKALEKWGQTKGLKGPQIYEMMVDKKTLNLIHKFRHFVKEDFKEHLDQKNHKANVKWFKENFHRTGDKEEKFQKRLKEYTEFINRTATSEKDKYERMQEWLNQNDIKHKDGDNKAWYNEYVQYYLTPIDPEEYYTDEYKKLLEPANKPLLDFYNFYTEHMVELSKKVDFKMNETFVPEIRKDTIDTMVQDGIFAGWRQQAVNLSNYFSIHDKDDGFQTIEDGTKNGKKVPIFFTDSVGIANKSLDLAKSLMIFSDFVENYSGVKDIEHSVLAMRELVSKTSGIRTNWQGKTLRTASGEIDLKDGPNEKLLEVFDKWINYYIYGETKEGDPFQNKVVDAMTKVSSRKSVALNFLSAVGGHINTAAQLDMIASKTAQFDDELLKKGRKETSRYKAFLDTVGKAKDATESLDSKSVFADFFFEIQSDDLSFEKANSVSLATMRKAMAKDYAFILQRWSDNVIESTTLNTMLMSYGIDPNTGKTYPIKRLKEMYANDAKYKDFEWKSLWDSLDMEAKDKDGNKQPMFINQHTGEKMTDGTYTDFRRKVKHLIAKAKGNMSSEDIAGYRTHMLGRLVMQFRGWIPATVRERVKSEQYSLTMEQFEVGRWVAAYEMVGKNLKRVGGQFIKQMIPFVGGDFYKDKDSSTHPMRLKYEQYIADNPHLKPDPAKPSPEHITYEQYYNTYVGEVKALAREVQTYLALFAALGLICLAAGDDELNENPVLRLTNALMERTMLEIGFYVPGFGIGEQYQLLVRQPISSLGLLSDVGKTVSNTIGETYDTIFGADWDKTVTPRLGDKSWEIDYKERTDGTPWLYYSHQFIPPWKLFEDVMGTMNITDRKDTVYDYLLDNSGMVYKY